MVDTLVVAAYEPELTGLSAVVTTAAVGIGAIDAAAGMAAALARFQPARVVLLGTCGAFGSARVGDVVVVERAVWLDTSPGVEVPEVVPRAVDGDAKLVARLAETVGASRVVVVCVAGVTVDDEAAQVHSGHGEVEHMECFAVYRACALAGVPVAAVLAVANRVGLGAREEWRRNAVAAETAAVAAVRRALGGL